MVKKRYVTKIKAPYRFNPVGDRDGNPSKYHKLYRDWEEFTVNPVLLQQLQVQDCHENTPEGKAIWLYLRLCQLLKFDEKCFFADVQHNPNCDLEDSFKIVGKVTAETPVSCYNFTRIATKLLNQIEGVHAVMIVVGKIRGHLRFGFYTDKISVDCEPTTTINHFNDLARMKLGMMPQGLRFLHGKWLQADLIQRIAGPMLAEKRDLQQYLHKLPSVPVKAQFAQLPTTVKMFRKHGVDGNSALQALLDLNRECGEVGYQLLRVGQLSAGELQPQLLVRSWQDLRRIDLNQMQMHNLTADELLDNLHWGKWVYVDENERDTQEELDRKRFLRESFVYGLQTKTHGTVDKAAERVLS